eukprot:maker-scaffold282_size228295-snap-gene-1.24 protein:Tk05529 transcript:maker-scaffold282_size228295-snap-gene-1.24-mRNA-1 annotation:"hypothetical protein DAPPUDRAFT_306029"
MVEQGRIDESPIFSSAGSILPLGGIIMTEVFRVLALSMFEAMNLRTSTASCSKPLTASSESSLPFAHRASPIRAASSSVRTGFELQARVHRRISGPSMNGMSELAHHEMKNARMHYESVQASASYLLERTKCRPSIAVICGSGIVMYLCGVRKIIITNAAGGLNPAFKIGDVMMIQDHVNLQGFIGNHPLSGRKDDRFGPHFFAMNHAYPPHWRRHCRRIMREMGLGHHCQEGVYTMLGGPNFETPAELRLLKALGVDAVGMSTVHEVVTAVQCGMSVFGFSLITNACVIDYETEEGASVGEVMETAHHREEDLKILVKGMVQVDWSKFGLHHKSPVHFVTSQWQPKKDRIHLGFVIYKVVIFLFALGNYIGNLATSSEGAYFLIYMTNQGITILLLEQILSTGLLAYHFWNHRTQPNPVVSSFYKVSWTITNITWTSAVFISIFYWSILYDNNFNYFGFFVHGLNSVICLLDLLVSARPFRMHHVYIPALFGVWYVLFSLIYFWAGGTDAEGNGYIYSVLDWSNPGLSIGVVCGAAVGIVVVHALIFGLYKLRVFCSGPSTDSEDDEQHFFTNADKEVELPAGRVSYIDV